MLLSDQSGPTAAEKFTRYMASHTLATTSPEDFLFSAVGTMSAASFMCPPEIVWLIGRVMAPFIFAGHKVVKVAYDSDAGAPVRISIGNTQAPVFCITDVGTGVLTSRLYPTPVDITG